LESNPHSPSSRVSYATQHKIKKMGMNFDVDFGQDDNAVLEEMEKRKKSDDVYVDVPFDTGMDVLDLSVMYDSTKGICGASTVMDSSDASEFLINVRDAAKKNGIKLHDGIIGHVGDTKVTGVWGPRWGDINKEKVDEYVDVMKRNGVKNATVSFRVDAYSGDHSIMPRQGRLIAGTTFETKDGKKQSYLFEGNLNDKTFKGSTVGYLFQALGKEGYAVQKGLDVKTANVYRQLRS